MEHSGSTKDFGWCIDIKCYKNKDNIYFEVKEAVEYLQIQRHINKNGFKYIDKFLCENGE